jgi:hypothetical protein
MASLASGLFDLFEGNPTQREQEQFGGLSSEQLGAGEGAETTAETYFNNLLTNPTVALAPEIAAGQGQVEQQRLQDANFGTRSGGTAAATEAAEGAERGNIINLMGQTQGSAANALGTLGEAQVGAGSSALGSEATLANQRRQQLNQDVGGIAQGAAEIAAPFLGGGGGSAPEGGFLPAQLTSFGPNEGAPPPDLTPSEAEGLGPSLFDPNLFAGYNTPNVTGP